MKQYLDIVKKVLEEGKWKSPVRKNHQTGKWEPVDGGVRTLACANVLFSHDMCNGFPLLTTRKMPWKSICKELEFFIKGYTNKQWLKDVGCKYWDYWCDPSLINSHPVMKEFSYDESISHEEADKEWNSRKKYVQEDINDLGPIGYSHGWRNFGGDYVPIPQVYSPYVYNKDNIYNIASKSKSDSKHIGQTYESNNYGKFTVVDAYSTSGKNRRCYYDIIFNDTGYRANKISSSNISKKNVKDLYYPTICNIACIGETAKKSDPLYSIWRNMINRCYNKDSINYKYYGERGVRVCNEWLNASVFIEDVKFLPGWEDKKNSWKEYSIDKDLLGNGLLYSKENCCWIDEKTQKRNTIRNRVFEAISPDNIHYISDCIKDFANKYDLDSSIISKALDKKIDNVKGWKFNHIRYKNESKKGTDQLKNIVETLQNNPMDRRMVCSGWNPNDLNRVALPCCHYSFVVSVIDDTLNLFWSQRSCDLLLGVPSNIASYGLLLCLLAEVGGFKRGNLSGMLVDCHIYENQIDAATKQVEREPRPLPQLSIKKQCGPIEQVKNYLNNKKDCFDIFNWTYEDVHLSDYNPHEKLDFGKVVV